MKVLVRPGKYVLAVSGGVDSMVLLNLLAKKPAIELIVAHFNHGIREDSDKDEQLVRQIAKKLGLSFEAGHGYLGAHASEGTARRARYDFLRAVNDRHEADAIITAHHLDDYLETAMINLIRGTGRRGLSAIRVNKEVLRPLISYSKSEIIAYARQKKLVWREDHTNAIDAHLRNYIRNRILSDLSPDKKKLLVENIDKAAALDSRIEDEIAKLSRLSLRNKTIDRETFNLLPASIGDELVVYWLRQNNVKDLNQKTVSLVSNAIRTNHGNTICQVRKNLSIKFTSKAARFTAA
jgi:tRNA(Ile)-lysidine synthetase-like protein